MGARMTIHDSVKKKLDERRARNAIEKALRQTMLDLQKAAMRNTPVDTGNLRRSHSTEVRFGGNAIEGLLRNSTNYWQYVNFGTSKMAARPFVTQAMESVNPSARMKQYFDQYFKT